MTDVLGIRAEPSAISWAVVGGYKTAPVLIADGEARAPVAFNEAQSLSWYRDRILHIVQQYKLAIVAIRYPEPKGKAAGSDAIRRRARIEGVVLESTNSVGLRVVTGALVTISANLQTKSAKTFLEHDDLRGLDWSKRPLHRREAILVAVSVMEA